jgi:glycosyltransferase involved in cell wall biosynthesis
MALLIKRSTLGNDMRVSIGLSFYNNEKTLADAVRSVFAQTFQGWELILVDDGSSDGSLKIAQVLDDPRVHVVRDMVNKGLSFRLNQIATLAGGAYIARMDADDLMHPERLARQVEYLDAHPEVDLIGTGTYTIDSADRPLGLRGVGVFDVRPQVVLSRGLTIHPTVTGRADWFRRNPYDESLAYVRAEDRELWCRTCQSSVFAHLSEPLHFYREEAVVRGKAAAYLRNYLLSCRSDRNILVTYGPSMAGWPRTLLLILKSHLKGATYHLFTALAIQSVLIKKRNIPLSESERLVASKVLNTILQTPVPGLSSLNSMAEC